MSEKDPIKKAFDSLKLDVTNAALIPSGGVHLENKNFDINANDFLKFAKDDFRDGNNKGLVNSITNSKRAIDCCVDQTFHGLSVDLEECNHLEEFCRLAGADNHESKKLDLMEALNYGPVYTISKVRKIRNNLEHEYKLPNKEKVKEAIDIAELFVRNVEAKFKFSTNEFFVTDRENYQDEFDFKKGLSVIINSESLRVDVWEDGSGNMPNSLGRIQLKVNNSSYLPLVRLMNSIDDHDQIQRSFRILLSMIDHAVPAEQISIRQV